MTRSSGRPQGKSHDQSFGHSNRTKKYSIVSLHTFAHSGTVVDNKRRDIFVISHLQSRVVSSSSSVGSC